MTFFYLLVILHLLFGLLCAHMVKATGLKPEPWFVAGTVLGGLGLALCCLCLSDWKKPIRRTHPRMAS
jgi:hypothetical protein